MLPLFVSNGVVLTIRLRQYCIQLISKLDLYADISKVVGPVDLYVSTVH